LTEDQAVKDVGNNVSDCWVNVWPVCARTVLLLLPPLALLGAWCRLCTHAEQCCCYQLPYLQFEVKE
jgi:hypothetical protein